MMCECVDSGCSCYGDCAEDGAVRLYRCDMNDHIGTLFCQDCADDAYGAGVFSDEAPD